MINNNKQGAQDGIKIDNFEIQIRIGIIPRDYKLVVFLSADFNNSALQLNYI